MGPGRRRPRRGLPIAALAALAAGMVASPASTAAREGASGVAREGPSATAPVGDQGVPARGPAGRPAADEADNPAGAAAADTVDALFPGLRFRMVGPTRGGRVTAVAGHRSLPCTFWMGATGGGVWKTTTCGHSWHNVSDGTFETPSIGAIAVAPSDPDILYVGTGSDGIRSNVITGRGIYKSSDGGESWTFLGLREAGQIGSVVMHPEDPDIAWAAALGHPFGRNPMRGIFRTRDGGETWENVLFVSDSVGAVDLELHPADPSVLYAALWRAERKPWTIISGALAASGDGVWKSVDGGDTWRRVSHGLPDGLIGKADFAVSPADPERVYALVEAPEPKEGLYRSDDAGETWRLVSRRSGLMSRPFYFTNVTADPTDADVVYVGNVRAYRSSDGGESWERWPTPHVDNHDLWIHPLDPRVMVLGNDGGATVTLDGGATWSTQFNQPTAELYQVDVDDRFPYWLYAGMQDNATAVAVPSLPPTAESGGVRADHGWYEAVGACETGPAVPKPGEPRIVFGNCKGRFDVYDRETGQERQYWVGARYMYGHNPKDLKYRFQRTVPIEVSPHDPDVVYHASQFVHRSADGGATWETISPDLTAFRPERQVVSGRPITRDVTGEEHYSALYVVEESPLAQGELWTGANDGPVHVTLDGGDTWTEVTPPGMPPEGRINAIDISRHRRGKAYVAGYRLLLDDWAPYVYRTTDHGRTWTRIADGTNGIPADVPVRVVREDPEREGLLYAGTEFGFYVSFDDGRGWHRFQRNLPVTPVTDIELHRGDAVLSTMGRSFWVLDDPAPLRQWAAEVARAEAHLFRPRDAARMRYEPSGEPEGAPTSPVYPPPGVALDYWLGATPPTPLVLEILDGRGEVIRRFEATGREADRADSLPSAESPLALGRGAHRFRWDMRYPGPRGGDSGPLAPPGEYGARLSAGDVSVERSFRLHIDPRVEAKGIGAADLEEQFRLNLRIRDAIDAARALAAEIDSLQAGLEVAASGEAAAGAARALQRRLQAVKELIVTSGEGSYPQPMLVDQLEYLYGMTTQADQRPGRDAYERLEELRAELAGRRALVAGIGAEAGPLLEGG